VLVGIAMLFLSGGCHEISLRYRKRLSAEVR